jgi:hypothetical protein
VVVAFSRIPEVDLRRLRELCKRFHPGLSLPSDLFVGLAETGSGPKRTAEDARAR